MYSPVDIHLTFGPSFAFALPPKNPAFGRMVSPLFKPRSMNFLYLSYLALVFLPSTYQAEYSGMECGVGLCGV